MQISIIIVNYNVKYFLEQCLLSVVKASQNLAVEILVVDNNSTDGSKEFFKNKFQQVKFFWQDENVGFGKANNFALLKAKGDFILFLNPDTILEEATLINSLQFYTTHANAGGLGVKMLDGSGNFLKESKRMLPDFSTSVFKMLGFSNLFPGSKIFDRYYAGQVNENETSEIDILAGAYFMLPMAVAKQLAGFDPDFFMYGEDVDLSYRIQKSGFENYYFPEITLLHFKGESTQKKSAFYVKHFYGAMQLFIDKHFKDKIARPFIKFTINQAAYFANLKIAISKLWQQPAINIKDFKVILVGGKVEITFLKSYWPATELLAKPSAEVEVGESDDLAVIFKNIKNGLSENKNVVVFAEGILSNSDSFSLMQNLKFETAFLFHQKNSSALIGSGSRNSKGLVIPLTVL